MAGNCFTQKGPGLLKSLEVDVVVTHPLPSGTTKGECKGKQIRAILDTGATGSAIPVGFAEAIGIKPSGLAKVHHADGESTVNTYIVGIFLPNNVGFSPVKVTEARVLDNKMLIGMDILSKGDFAVTNKGGETTFTFRVPTMETIDFVTDPLRAGGKVGRNDPCPCGKPKKYKNCCGRNA